MRRDHWALDGLHLTRPLREQPIDTSTHKRPRYHNHNGFLMPLGFPPEGFDSGLTYGPHTGDIVVSSYPKCGTTWLQYVVYLLQHGAVPLPEGKTLPDVFPHLEEVGAAAVEALPEPRLVKTHLPLAMTPWSSEARYLYIARNPFDCAVSFYHHTRGFVIHYDFEDGRFEDFFECFIDGAVDFGDYFDNLVPWVEHAAAADNVLLLTYEQMKRDASEALGSIGEFLGGAALETARDPELRPRVLTESRFDRMRKDQRRWSSERPAGKPEFVRKGVVGDWKHHFTPEQARRLVEKFEGRTAGTPAAELWPETLAEARAFGA